MEMAIVMTRESGMDWIIHLDTDELIHPAGTQEYSLRQFLSDVPGNVDMVIFPNYESSVERDDIKEPHVDDPDNYGLEVTKPEALLNMTMESDLNGLQLLKVKSEVLIEFTGVIGRKIAKIFQTQ